MIKKELELVFFIIFPLGISCDLSGLLSVNGVLRLSHPYQDVGVGKNIVIG